ncbi:aldehyde dehydrogenase family protein [Sinomonas atrocyanea]|uniref:aldehyde dehydrogenase family protein n=1 Tax=Sinomonas atrocyanea TaxID=37927 RepID=UPI00286A23E8|nr:aldehyde dehydrogenase family protein [Sinomonas atrocyanea]
MPAGTLGITISLRREPLGVFALIAPWNFSIAIPTRKAAWWATRWPARRAGGRALLHRVYGREPAPQGHLGRAPSPGAARDGRVNRPTSRAGPQRAVRWGEGLVCEYVSGSRAAGQWSSTR